MHPILNQISIAAAGFSVIALALLVLQTRTESQVAKRLAKTLLCILMVVQILQGLYITHYLLFANAVAFAYLLLLGFVGLFFIYTANMSSTLKKNGLCKKAGIFYP